MFQIAFMASWELWVVGQGVAEHGDEHQQQREQRQETVVREQRRVLAGLVVADLLDHADGEPEHAVALLEPVEGPQGALDPLHHGASLPGGPVPAHHPGWVNPGASSPTGDDGARSPCFHGATGRGGVMTLWKPDEPGPPPSHAGARSPVTRLRRQAGRAGAAVPAW